MKYLTLEETIEIMINEIGKLELKIEQETIKDFKWGSLFYPVASNYEKTGNIIGLPFFLIDKITGEITPIDYQKSLPPQDHS